MKNLENYGVLEMDAGEIEKTDGGVFGLDDAIAVVGGLIAIGYAIDDFVAGWNSVECTQ